MEHSLTEGETDSWYDPELPFLVALEREVERAAVDATRIRVRTRAHQARAHSRPTIAAAPTGRVLRRTLTLVALLCLIAASAFGARAALSTHSDPTALRPGSFVLAAHGSAGADHWSLRAYRLGGQLCEVLVVADNENSRCAPQPGGRGLSPGEVVSPLRRYVFGDAGPQVAAVAVRAGGATQTVPTHALDADAGRAAGLPAGVRYFVATFERSTDGTEPVALVRALDAGMRQLGPTLSVCALADEPSNCSA